MEKNNNNYTNPIRKNSLKDFRMDQVKLTSEVHIHAFSKEIEYLKSYNSDRLVAGFRENRGLDTKAAVYPGWESTEIKGHTLGHYLTACSQAYLNTRDSELRQRMDYLIKELSSSQFENGYISAFPEMLFDHVENNQPAWVPWYTMHKIIAGILDVYEATNNQKAFDIVKKLGDWVAERTERWTPEVHARVLSVEYGGMNDCLYELYKSSGDERHLQAAHRFDELTLFTPVQQGNDILKGRHANTTIPKFLGALNRYMVLGESESFYLEACVQFWDMVVHEHSYITGGNSEWEHFGEPGILNSERSNFTCETCNSYNMLKLTRELFKITGDVKYADFYENTLINAILSSQNPETGMTMYFQPMATGYFKVYSSPFEHFWCCTGTGMESFTKLNDSIYFQGGISLYVNQYVGSTLTWEENGIQLIQSTTLPYTDTVQFVIHTLDSLDKEFALHLRMPYWSAGPLELTLNGVGIQGSLQDHYLLLDRQWRDGDLLEVRIPMAASYESLPDAKHVVGFRYGPVVLSAGLGADDMVKSSTGVMVSVPTQSMLIKDFITTKGISAEQWLEHFSEHFVKKEDELAFKLRNTDEDEHLVFTPHYKQHEERYGIYWSLVEADSEELQQHLLQTKKNQRTADATIDSLPVGNDQYELVHQIHGERTTVGTWDGYTFRRAHEGGWFSYQMKVIPDVDNYLSVLCFSGNTGRAFELYVDGRLCESESEEPYVTRSFYEVRYLLPAELLNRKQQMEVKFVAKDGMNGIYDLLRTMKSYDNNADLTSLSFDIGQLSPEFHPKVADYTLRIPEGTSQVQFNAVPEHKNALIFLNDLLIDESIPREVLIQDQMTQLNLVVKAEDFSTFNSYKVVIAKG
ncbi:beta-L-arabinofuranosidase domain-containing protein [Paenibacillus wynnii]|uniref:Uncharacterized protein n=1 Tax=Paenibacillus wynnii TaxID=268407 RepID=A0A098M2H2_9BACL|nr:beta-L-arabinofuranosidase domain-containing protein [Paenibacillus wynnii]KGE16510.1 hypothetical protein PWYN_17425 [Paenibacillus wynnii]